MKDFIFALDYFTNKVNYQLHFINNIMPVSDSDYKYIKSQMEEALNSNNK